MSIGGLGGLSFVGKMFIYICIFFQSRDGLVSWVLLVFVFSMLVWGVLFQVLRFIEVVFLMLGVKYRGICEVEWILDRILVIIYQFFRFFFFGWENIVVSLVVQDGYGVGILFVIRVWRVNVIQQVMLDSFFGWGFRMGLEFYLLISLVVRELE